MVELTQIQPGYEALYPLKSGIISLDLAITTADTSVADAMKHVCILGRSIACYLNESSQDSLFQ